MKLVNYFVNNHRYRDINPLVCGQHICKPKHRFDSVREYYLLHYVVSGKGNFHAGSKDYPVRAGECFFIRPGEYTYYEADKEEPWHYIWIGFECRVPLPKTFEKRVVASRKLGAIFDRFNELETLKKGRESFICARVWEIISELDAPSQEQTNKPEVYVEQAISCIENEYMTPLYIDEIAKRLNLNRSYFSMLFKQHTGISPQAYLLEFRLKKAATLITKGECSITQAALSTGYNDVFSFSKMFKKKYGCSPSEYKKQDSVKNK